MVTKVKNEDRKKKKGILPKYPPKTDFLAHGPLSCTWSTSSCRLGACIYDNDVRNIRFLSLAGTDNCWQIPFPHALLWRKSCYFRSKKRTSL